MALEANNLSAPGPGWLLDLVYDFHLDVANNGNVVQIVNNLDAARTQTFIYDELNRIQTAEVPTTWGLSYGYDIWGNLLSRTVTKGSAPALNLTVNTKNQITNVGFSYDAAGNMTNDGSLAYTYDAENRMTSTAGVSYTYDGDGKRVKKSNGTLYWHGLAGQVLVETDLGGVLKDEYVFFNGQRIARRKASGEVSYYFSDHLGSSRVVTSATGQILDDADFYPFGGERPVVSTSSNNYKFTGQERDPESGLDYFLARHYASTLGRFLQPDEFEGGPIDAFSSNDPLPPGPLPYADIETPQSLNKYAYAYNNPLKYVDPDGHVIDTIIDVISAAISIREAINNPTPSNIFFAAVDTLAAAVPFVPGGIGIARKGAKAANALDNTTDAARSANKAENAVDTAEAANKVPNPHGSPGKPDHQAKVDELVRKAKKEAQPGERVVREKQIIGRNSTRRPDAQILDKNRRTRKVFEADRHPNRKRSRTRDQEYRRKKIPHETHKVEPR